MTVRPEPRPAFSDVEITPSDSSRGPDAPHLRDSLSLDGEWMFQFGDGSPHPIQVPAPWESQRPDLRNRAGTAVYERTLTLPETFAGRRSFLRFGAVDHFAEVWVNGLFIGRHEGGYTPFEFDITHALHGFGP